MQLSKTELIVLEQIGKGNKRVPSVARALKISSSQVYRIAQKLNKKGIISLSKGILEPSVKTYVSLLLQLMAKHPKLAKPFSGTGLKIYTMIIKLKTVRELMEQTDLHKTTVFKKLNEGLKISLVYPKDHTYVVNDKIWPKAKEFLIELKKYEESIDERVPVNATIYFKNDLEIVFSSKEELDAVPTAFSAYERYGLKLFTVTNYYYLPKKKPTKKDVFTHSLYVADKSQEVRHLIFVALFYFKFRKDLYKVEHQIIEKLKKIRKGVKVERFPTLAEIKNRAEVYDIKV